MQPKKHSTAYLERIESAPTISEESLQIAFFEYVRIKAISDPRYELIFSIPNQRAGKIAGYRMKLAGQKKGASDIFIAVPSKNYHGFFLELKTLRGKASPEQIDFIKATTAQGYYALILATDSLQEIIDTVEAYLNVP
jgi:hypothetical protein